MIPFSLPDGADKWSLDGPQEGESSIWRREDANPWQMRAVYSWTTIVKDLPELKRHEILFEQGWWAAVWDDIIDNHGADDALNFWRHFAAREAFQARVIALGGIARFNWKPIEAIFSIGRRLGEQGNSLHAAFLERDFPGRGRELDIRLGELHLGRWLANAIQTGDHAALRKLHDLVKGKKPPQHPDLSGTEQFKILDAFVSLVLTKGRLPRRAELIGEVYPAKKKGNFQKYARELGLGGLPEEMARRA